MIESFAANSDLVEQHQKIERLLMEVQDWIIDTRMVPVSMFFRSHARTVRDAAKRAAQASPSQDRGGAGAGRHGHRRKRAGRAHAPGAQRRRPRHRAAECAGRPGKDPQGTVTLRAAQNGNQVVIQVADDGAGFNLSKIRSRARLLGRANVDSLSVQELHQLVFAPRFLDGRQGHRAVRTGRRHGCEWRRGEDLHGTVEIDSTEGAGTTVELRLPLVFP